MRQKFSKIWWGRQKIPAMTMVDGIPIKRSNILTFFSSYMMEFTTGCYVTFLLFWCNNNCRAWKPAKMSHEKLSVYKQQWLPTAQAGAHLCKYVGNPQVHWLITWSWIMTYLSQILWREWFSMKHVDFQHPAGQASRSNTSWTNPHLPFPLKDQHYHLFIYFPSQEKDPEQLSSLWNFNREKNHRHISKRVNTLTVWAALIPLRSPGGSNQCERW